MNYSLIKRLYRNASKSIWTFPFILLIAITLLTVFRISGTSIGSYNNIFSNGKDSNLIYGKPNPLRSDEWLVNTQYTISQKLNNFELKNSDIGYGLNMAVIGDLPYASWSIIFEPQNITFFIFSLEYAFALKWWFLLFMLIISAYFFILEILPNKKLFASLFSLAIGLSPFVFWWYQTGTIATLSYGFLMALIITKLFNRNVGLSRYNKYRDYLLGIMLFYCVTAFGLIIYPPFQIPIMISLIFYTIGLLLNMLVNEKSSIKTIFRIISVLFFSILASLAAIGIFVVQNISTIKTITNTAYPGERLIHSGGINFLHIFDSYLMPQLQRIERGVHFFNNQSEVSNFILLLPFLLIPGFVLIYLKKKQNAIIDWPLLMVQLAACIFLARVFIPYGDQLYNLLFLDKVPHERLLIGFGFLGFLQLIFIIKVLDEIYIKHRLILSATYSIICFFTLAMISFLVVESYPLFISKIVSLILAFIFTLIIYFLLIGKFKIFSLILLIFSFISIYNINPLYKGFGTLVNNPLSDQIKIIGNSDDTWAVIDSLALENIALINNRHSLTGTYLYPNNDLWEELVNKNSNYIVNRYAHIIFTDNKFMKDDIMLKQADLVVIKLSCSSFVLKNVDYFIAPNKLSYSCMELVNEIKLDNNNTFYVYRVNI